MDRFSSLLLMVIVAIGVLICGGLLSERITAVVHRRAPRFRYDGEIFLLWGLLVVAAFALGLMVMYLLIRF
jgi:hypothetical protein